MVVASHANMLATQQKEAGAADTLGCLHKIWPSKLSEERCPPEKQAFVEVMHGEDGKDDDIEFSRLESFLTVGQRSAIYKTDEIKAYVEEGENQSPPTLEQYAWLDDRETATRTKRSYDGKLSPTEFLKHMQTPVRLLLQASPNC